MSHQKKSPVTSSQDNAEIAGIKLTHPDRVLYPGQGITKLELAQYYEQVADWMTAACEGTALDPGALSVRTQKAMLLPKARNRVVARSHPQYPRQRRTVHGFLRIG